MDKRPENVAQARWAGIALLGTIVVGALSALVVSQGIDINLSGKLAETAANMLEAEAHLRARAYLVIMLFVLGVVFSIGVYTVLQQFGPMLSATSLAVSLSAGLLSLLGAVAAMNAADLSGQTDYLALANQQQLLLRAAAEASMDYNSFHLALVLTSLGNAGFFLLFLRSGSIPLAISAWGLIASLFVAVVVVGRDFFPVLGADTITTAFLGANFIALVSLGTYLTIWGVRLKPLDPT